MTRVMDPSLVPGVPDHLHPSSTVTPRRNNRKGGSGLLVGISPLECVHGCVLVEILYFTLQGQSAATCAWLQSAFNTLVCGYLIICSACHLPDPPFSPIVPTERVEGMGMKLYGPLTPTTRNCWGISIKCQY